MIDYSNGDTVISSDGVSGLVVDGSVMWADSRPREESDINFIVRYTDTTAEITQKKPVFDIPVLEFGARGFWVAICQTALKCKGYYKGTIDGDFRELTHDAVYNFRKDNYLNGDSVIDSECVKYLFTDN